MFCASWLSYDGVSRFERMQISNTILRNHSAVKGVRSGRRRSQPTYALVCRFRSYDHLQCLNLIPLVDLTLQPVLHVLICSPILSILFLFAYFDQRKPTLKQFRVINYGVYETQNNFLRQQFSKFYTVII